jgi:diamine N-acetyltransferase
MPVSSSLMLHLSKAGPADADAIAQLAENIWRLHYVPIIGADQVEYMLSTMHSAEKIREQMKAGQTYCFIKQNEEAIGYVAWSKPREEELFIHKLYVHPAKQGKGVGRQIFADILELNPEVNTIRLTVNRNNYKSINFYFRVGFTIEEVKDFDIGNGYFMNDFVMLWQTQK